MHKFEASIKFASSFIFVMFSSAVLGYYLGKEFFGFKFEYCMALSGLLTFCSIVAETILFIAKDAKKNSN